MRTSPQGKRPKQQNVHVASYPSSNGRVGFDTLVTCRHDYIARTQLGRQAHAKIIRQCLFYSRNTNMENRARRREDMDALSADAASKVSRKSTCHLWAGVKLDELPVSRTRVYGRFQGQVARVFAPGSLSCTDSDAATNAATSVFRLAPESSALGSLGCADECRSD